MLTVSRDIFGKHYRRLDEDELSDLYAFLALASVEGEEIKAARQG